MSSGTLERMDSLGGRLDRVPGEIGPGPCRSDQMMRDEAIKLMRDEATKRNQGGGIRNTFLLFNSRDDQFMTSICWFDSRV
jgi:hypothetical protein